MNGQVSSAEALMTLLNRFDVISEVKAVILNVAGLFIVLTSCLCQIPVNGDIISRRPALT